MHSVCHLCWIQKKKLQHFSKQPLESTFNTKGTGEAQSHEQENANSGSIKGV